MRISLDECGVSGMLSEEVQLDALFAQKRVFLNPGVLKTHHDAPLIR
jgi:hypothetical protein